MNGSRKYLVMSLALLLGLTAAAAFGATGMSASPPTPLPTDQGRAGTPPVEQALVPEGVFALQLMEALKMGSTQDEAQAESQLSAIGIEPKKGWIAGYPMTPPAMVEIEKSVVAAAEGGKLRMSKEEALRAVGDLKTRLGLSINPEAGAPPPSTLRGGPGNTIIYKYVDRTGVIHFTDQYESIPTEYRNRVEMIRETFRPPASGEPSEQEMQTPTIPGPAPEAVNNYYYDYGPPVVTYYPPPQPYYYLYSWVPYPFWWGAGFYYSGYFILHDFHRHVGFHGKPYVCTNHVAAHNQWYAVNPHTRGLQNSSMAGRVSSPQVFNSPGVQSSARTIVGLNQNRPASGNVQSQPRLAASSATAAVNRFQAPPRPTTQQRVTTGPVGGTGSNFVRAGAPPARTFTPPSTGGRFFTPSPPRVASAPPAAAMHGPVYGAPAPNGRGGSFGGVRSTGGVSSSGGSGSRGGSFRSGSGARGGGRR